MLKLYNTLTRKEETFKPLRPKQAGMYCCGPTVYDFAHIGNFRTYVFEDILKRVLAYNGYKVKHVMNITDVGHLTSDSDTGEDKLEKGAKRENKTVWEVADFYTKHFQKDLQALNILEPDVWIKATDTIKEQLALIATLEKKGFTYTIADGVYFDTSKLKKYGVLWGNKKEVSLQAGARIDVVEGKKNPTDFALWKLTPKGVKRQMEWQSPWGAGFPGWHTECVVMAQKELASPFDIHCGGIDHIQIHHTNEIAQSQAAFGNNLANFWIHGDFLNIKGEKISKSLGNIYTIDDLIKEGFNPLALRYLFLTAKYKAKMDFTFESLQAAHNALQKLQSIILNLMVAEIKNKYSDNRARSALSKIFLQYQQLFLESINNDLNTPQALALAWQAVNDKALSPTEKYALLIDFDKVFGLGLKDIQQEKINIPAEIKQLSQQREKARQTKNWQLADAIRKQIEALGFEVEDTSKGVKLKTKT